MPPPLHTVETPSLLIAYHDSGPADGPVSILLHGFPYDPRAYDTVAEFLAAQGLRVLVPYLRGYGATRFRDAATLRSGQQAALGHDLRDFMDALAVPQATLAGYDWGGRAACVVAALWPERARGLVTGDGYNIFDHAAMAQPVAPAHEHRLWYQFYFHSPRGEIALRERRAELCRYIWEIWSPAWRFDDATFAASAPSFDNPDFAEVVRHSYRHRFGYVPGDPAFDATEALLARQPEIVVPTVALFGANDGLNAPGEVDPLQSSTQFTGRYRTGLLPGIGHNIPQEAPEAFARAVLEVTA